MRVSFESAQRAYDNQEPEEDQDTMEDVPCFWCGKNLGPARPVHGKVHECAECLEEQEE